MPFSITIVQPARAAVGGMNRVGVAARVGPDHDRGMTVLRGSGEMTGNVKTLDPRMAGFRRCPCVFRRLLVQRGLRVQKDPAEASGMASV
jgi:hypothetical protein